MGTPLVASNLSHTSREGGGAVGRGGAEGARGRHRVRPRRGLSRAPHNVWQPRSVGRARDYNSDSSLHVCIPNDHRSPRSVVRVCQEHATRDGFCASPALVQVRGWHARDVPAADAAAFAAKTGMTLRYARLCLD
eukprot:gene12651-biopygen4788